MFKYIIIDNWDETENSISLDDNQGYRIEVEYIEKDGMVSIGLPDQMFVSLDEAKRIAKKILSWQLKR